MAGPLAADSAAGAAAGSKDSVNAILLNGVSLHANQQIGIPGELSRHLLAARKLFDS